jgi:COP9 signalosome complex subunit 4
MKRAAQTLGSFKFEQYRTLQVPPAEKLAWHIDTAEFWLEAEELAHAAQSVKKAHPIVAEVKNDPKLVFRFKTAWARVLDAERKFYDAAMKYLDLSQSGTELKYSESDMLQTLENAVTCAILSPPSSARSRVLGMLMSDQRSSQLRNYNMLEKMFKEHIVRQSDVDQFQKLLATHQNAETSTGRSVLANSIIEHNIFAASKIYNNITFSELAVLLGIKETEAEVLASKLIEEGRMKATIDQVDGVVEFESATDSLRVWDDQITQLCGVVNDVLENVVKKNPQYKQLM